MSAIPDSTLVDPKDEFIADLRLQLAECRAERDEAVVERDEALARETATAEVLQVINSSPGDLAPVFDAILEKAHILCGADTGSLQIYEGEIARAVATRGLPQRQAERLRQGVRPSAAHPTSRPRDGADFIQIPDISEVDNPLMRIAFQEGGIRTYLAVPLRKDDRLLGRIVAGRREVRPFTDKQIALLQNFAAQAVIAMENARLLTETREALAQQTATAEVLGVINSSPGNLAPVFDAMLEKAHSLCEAPLGSLVLCDGEQLRAMATRGYPQEYEAMARGGFSPIPPFKRLLSGEPFVQADAATGLPSDEDDPMRRAAVEIAGIRTALFVPLRKDRTVLGYISAQRREVRPFTDKQIALLQNFAAQAVIAMENARLLTETREALEQQTATAEVLQVINSSPGDLAPVFEAMLEKATRLCEADGGYFLRYQDGKHTFAAGHGLRPDFEAFLSQPYQPAASSPAALVAQGAPFIHIADAKNDDSYRSGAIRRRAIVDLGGFRTGLTVPMRRGDVVLGSFNLGRSEVRPFTDRQIALVQSFAAQAVIAIENARLITETHEALEQQTATAEVLGVINSSPGDLGPVFDAMLEKAVRLCGADFGSLGTYDGLKMHLAASRGFSTEAISAFREFEPPAGAMSYEIVQGAEMVHVADILTSEAYKLKVSSVVTLVDTTNIRTGLWIALRKEDDLLGMLQLYRTEVRPFSDKQIALVQNFAAQAVIAMENARLLGELRQRTEEVAELNRGLEERVAEQVEELGRVGRLKRFLAPQLAELIVSQGDEKILESHRREIVVVFCDLRGYTAFTETAEPEEVLDFLREYHGALGPLVSQFEGTLDQFSGDGIMVFFNDPVPIPDPAERAVRMAVAMREAATALISSWRRLGRDLGFGAGIAQGYATLGQIGFSERSGYTAIGTVCNVAARLCAEAKDGQILISQRVAARLDDNIALEDIGALTLKGLTQPVVAYNVPLAAGQPALRVIEGGPQSV